MSEHQKPSEPDISTLQRNAWDKIVAAAPPADIKTVRDAVRNTDPLQGDKPPQTVRNEEAPKFTCG